MPSKRTRWAAHMAAWQSSGLSQSAYCRRHALSLASFGYWRRQLRTDRDEADCAVPVTRALVPIRVAPASMTPVTSSMMEVCLGNGLRVRLAGGKRPVATTCFRAADCGVMSAPDLKGGPVLEKRRRAALAKARSVLVSLGLATEPSGSGPEDDASA